MKATSFFAVLGIFAFLFVIGCSNDTGVDNPTASSGPNPTVDIAKAGNVAIDIDTNCDNGLQQNDLVDDNLIIWVSNDPGSGDYCFRLFDKNSQVGCGDTFQFDGSCTKTGGGTFWFEDGSQIQNTPGSSGAFRAKVNVGACSGCSGVTGPNVGGDGFTVDLD